MRDHPDTAEHLSRCDDCQARAALDRAAFDVDLEKTWTAVAAEAWSREKSPLENLAARLLSSPGLARALVTTPSLLLSWILATAAVLAAGTLATDVIGEPVFALLAPALAGIGIAFAYGPGVDPAHELGRTMATPDRAILLVRALAVFGVNATLGLVASLFTTVTVGITLGWLVPMTTVSALALAVATLARSANVAVVVALCVWGVVVSAVGARTGDLAAAVASKALMPLYAAATVALVALILYASNGKRRERALWG